MRLAISPTTPGIGPAELLDVVTEAERVGYESAWLAEVTGPEAFAMAAAVAVGTRRMDLGVAVVPAATRSPALLAMGAATVSGLLSGRAFELGIGASSELIVRRWHGREFAPPLRRVRDAVQATRALLSGEHTYRGEFERVDRFRLGTLPAGPVRLFLGALGPGMLRLAGEIGDGVCLNLMTVEHVAAQLEEVRSGAEAAGRISTADFTVMARFHVVLTDDVAAGRDLIRVGFGPYFAQPVYNRLLAAMGFEEEADAIRTAFSDGDRAGVAAALHDDLIDRVTLVGPAPRVRRRLEEYAAAGIDIAALNFIAGDAAGVIAGLREMAPAG